MLETCWLALGGDASRLAELEVRHVGRWLPSAFDVDGLAVGSVGSMLLAAAELAEARGLPRPAVALDARHVAAAFTSERRMRRDGQAPPSTFAPLSRFARTADGWIRLHANYDHHRRALLRALDAEAGDALAAIARRDGAELEDAIVAAGGVAAAVRTSAAWRAHPQGAAAEALPLVERRPAPEHVVADPRAPRDPARPADGLRVVDLTRVIAGPVATRVLAALGADVLRIDPPQMPEDPVAMLDTCPGKRLVDLDLRHDAAVLHRLLNGADVLVHGYRPGALAAFGLGDDELAHRHPHLVVTSLSAWGRVGPWAARRGFDSLVQAASGIADVEARDGQPGVLPAQALDHATGYLIAAAVLRAAADRAAGRPWSSSRLALAATAAALMRAPRPAAGEAGDVDDAPYRDSYERDGAMVEVIRPPGTLAGTPLRWRGGPRPSVPSWG